MYHVSAQGVDERMIIIIIVIIIIKHRHSGIVIMKMTLS